MKKKIFFWVSVIIGLVFIVSGLGKVVNTAAFGNLIVKYGLGWLQIFAPLVAIAEIALGLCFVLGIRPKIMGQISVCLLVIFTATFTYGYLTSGITDCGCFGTLKIFPDNVAFVYVRNIVLLVLALYIGICYPASINKKTDEAKLIILLGVLLPAIFVAGLTYRIPNSFNSNRNESLLNRHIKETPLYQYIQTVPDSSYLAFFYTYACPHCWNSLENLKKFKSSGMVDCIVSFAIVNANSSDKSEIKNAFIANSGSIKTVEIVGDNIVRKFIKSVPTSFYIRNDTIKAVIESTLPHPFVFGRRTLTKHPIQ